MPVYDTDEDALTEAIESVRGQVYENWELCVADDVSSKPEVRRILREYVELDRRVGVQFLSKHEGIAGASNAAISTATGAFIGFLDHDDLLTGDALFEIVRLLNTNPDVDFIYTDEDKIDERNIRVDPFFKPDWSPDLLLTMHYAAHFAVYRTELVRKLRGLRKGFDGSQDYELALRATEATSRIAHIAKPVYSWRKLSSSTATSLSAKPTAREAQKKAVREALNRRGLVADVLDGYNNWNRIKYKLKDHPLVSVITICHNQPHVLKLCIDSIEHKTNYPNYEILVVDQESDEKQTIDYLKTLRSKHRVVRYEGAYNLARINNFAVDRTKASYLLFLNNNMEVITPDWMTEMVSIADSRDDVGIVGAKLLYCDGRIEHAGVVVGCEGASSHPFRGKPNSDAGYFGFPHVIRNWISVTAACMLVKRSVFKSLDGFDENMAVAGSDVDLGIRANRRGILTVYTPYAVLRYREDFTGQGPSPLAEKKYCTKKWALLLERDPYYNPNLSLESEQDLFTLPLDP